MNKKEKLGLMERVNYPGTHGSMGEPDDVDDGGESLYISGLENDLTLISTINIGEFESTHGGVCDEEDDLKDLRKIYDFMKTHYESVDFGELEEAVAEDEDSFRTPFLMRDCLPEFGRMVERYLSMDREEKMKELGKVVDRIKEADAYKGISYEGRMRNLRKSVEVV